MGGPSGPPFSFAWMSRAKEIYVGYIQNLYDIMEQLRTKHPELEIESCAGGGGRGLFRARC